MIDLPNVKSFITKAFSKDTNNVETNITIIVTTDEGQYSRTINVPGKVLTIGIANLSTNYSIDAGKDISF